MAPLGSYETHSHVFGPPDRYPPFEGRGRVPHPEASAAAYRAMLDRLDVERGVIVQPSLYADDNRATLDTIQNPGLERTRGVAVTRPDADRAELADLHAAGIRGMRFSSLPRTLDWTTSRRWHAGSSPSAGTWWCRAPGRTFLTGGPYMSSAYGPPRYGDAAPRARALVNARPDRMLWAANWPHPGSPLDDKPEEAECLDVLLDWAPDEAVRKAILVDNPAVLYGFD